MTVVFAFCLLSTLLLSAAVVLAPLRLRGRFKGLLVVSLLLAWLSLAMALTQIGARTASTLVTPGATRNPELVQSAAHEALELLVALGSPALVATGLGLFALWVTRAAADRKRERRQDRAGQEQHRDDSAGQ
jgi:hypothetical protein